MIEITFGSLSLRQSIICEQSRTLTCNGLKLCKVFLGFEFDGKALCITSGYSNGWAAFCCSVAAFRRI